MIITRKHGHFNKKYTIARYQVVNKGIWEWKITKYKINKTNFDKVGNKDELVSAFYQT